MRLLSLLPLLLGCVPTPNDGVSSELTSSAAEKGYGPDCAENLTFADIAASTTRVDWAALELDPALLRILVLDGEVSEVASAICDEALRQSSVVSYSSHSPTEEDTSTSASIDLSPYAGRTLFISASDESGAEFAYAFYVISSSSTNAVATLE